MPIINKLHTRRDAILSSLPEYIVLLATAFLYVLCLSVFRGQHAKQFIVTSIYILFYIGWSIIHHARDKSLHLRIVLEYVAVGALVLFIFRTLLFV